MRDTIKALNEMVRGRVIITSDRDYDDPHRAAEKYGANYERLSAVKAAYHPDNPFHVNQNIASAKRR